MIIVLKYDNIVPFSDLVRNIEDVHVAFPEQYSSALFIHDSCTCESTSTSSTDNIEIIQATLNDVIVNSHYKPPNQVLTSEVVQ